MNEVACTRRAERLAQRCGVASALHRTVIEYADVELPVGDGRNAIRVSNQGLCQLEDEHGSALAVRARDIVLIVSGDGRETLLLVLRAQGYPSRRYLRRVR